MPLMHGLQAWIFFPCCHLDQKSKRLEISDIGGLPLLDSRHRLIHRLPAVQEAMTSHAFWNKRKFCLINLDSPAKVAFCCPEQGGNWCDEAIDQDKFRLSPNKVMIPKMHNHIQTGGWVSNNAGDIMLLLAVQWKGACQFAWAAGLSTVHR